MEVYRKEFWKYYKQFVEEDDADAFRELIGWCPWDMLDHEEEQENIVRELEQLSSVTGATYHPFLLLAEIYRSCLWDVENDAKTFQFYCKAHELHKTPNTAYKIGLCYNNGRGVEKNRETALEWYKKAIGHPEAMYELGKTMIGHDSNEEVIEQGIKYLKDASIGGCGPASYELHRIYSASTNEHDQILGAQFLLSAYYQKDSNAITDMMLDAYYRQL